MGVRLGDRVVTMAWTRAASACAPDRYRCNLARPDRAEAAAKFKKLNAFSRKPLSCLNSVLRLWNSNGDHLERACVHHHPDAGWVAPGPGNEKSELRESHRLYS
jgi:hypothetical protein